MSENTLLIADSGSTKTDWLLLVRDGQTATERIVTTEGINPVLQQPDTIRRILPVAQLPAPTAVCFYGAGVTPEQAPLMTQLLSEAFPSARVEAHSDLLGAARALCQRTEGVACILGTGANSCLYDGSQIVAHTPALGYILGDEGSGAVLGRLFLNAVFKHQLPADLARHFLDTQQLTMADAIRRVYRESMANRWLASLSLYIHEHIHRPELHQLVVGNFRQFFQCNVRPYQRTDLPVSFVGSMAHYYESQLREAAAAEGYAVGRIERSPLAGLGAYHNAD